MTKLDRSGGQFPAAAKHTHPLNVLHPIWNDLGAPHAIEHHLGRSLQQMYAELPIPPVSGQLMELLGKLDLRTTG